MFGKAKNRENQYVIAVQDLAGVQKGLAAGTISLPFEKSIYSDLIARSNEKVDNLKELNKFVKAQKKNKGEVKYYWEGLIAQGYTLMNVIYDKKDPSIERLCDNGKFKLVCKIV